VGEDGGAGMSVMNDPPKHTHFPFFCFLFLCQSAHTQRLLARSPRGEVVLRPTPQFFPLSSTFTQTPSHVISAQLSPLPYPHDPPAWMRSAMPPSMRSALAPVSAVRTCGFLFLRNREEWRVRGVRAFVSCLSLH
jgi:hypothetical protein